MKTTMPLPLELNKPVALASDLDTLLSVGSTKYDPKTQMRPPEMWGSGGGHNTNSTCVNHGFIQVDDILQDFSL